MDFNTFYSLFSSSPSITLGRNSIKSFNIIGDVYEGSLLYASGDASSEWKSVWDVLSSVSLLDVINNLIETAVDDLSNELTPRIDAHDASIVSRDQIVNEIESQVDDLATESLSRVKNLEDGFVTRDQVIGEIEDQVSDAYGEVLPRLDGHDLSIVPRDQINNLIEEQVDDAVANLYPLVSYLLTSFPLSSDTIRAIFDQSIEDYVSYIDENIDWLTNTILQVQPIRDIITSLIDSSINDIEQYVEENISWLINTIMSIGPIQDFIQGMIDSSSESIRNDIDESSSALWELVTYTDTVSSLPGSPKHGQVIRYQSSSMLTDGVVWTLRYNTNNTSSYKWEFIGGPPWYAEVTTSETSTGTTYSALATAGPSVTAPLAGVYIIEFGSKQDYSVITTNRIARHSIDVGATAAVDADSVSSSHLNVVGVEQTVMRRIKKTLAAADAIVSKYKTGGDTVRFQARHLSLTPVNLG